MTETAPPIDLGAAASTDILRCADKPLNHTRGPIKLAYRPAAGLLVATSDVEEMGAFVRRWDVVLLAAPVPDTFAARPLAVPSAPAHTAIAQRARKAAIARIWDVEAARLEWLYEAHVVVRFTPRACEAT